MTANRRIVVQNDSFPKPTILKAFVGAGYIYADISEDPVTSDSFPTSPASPNFERGSIEKVNVLYSSSGARYELGRVLKKAIYGVVLHATLLSPVLTSEQVNQHKAFTRTHVSFAIKIYSKELIASHSSQSKENPFMEVAALQFLGDHHPSIMGQVECCADEAYVYSIMRFCPGGELFDHIAQCGRISEAESRRIFRQLMSGLQVLEDRGVGHLDISLENLLYNTSQQQIMIIDFGMCAKLMQKTSTEEEQKHFHTILNNYCGKKNYMAPEIIAQNSFIDAIKCDIWSAGICLLYILLGFPPIEVASVSDLRYRYLINGKLNELLEHWGCCLSAEVIDLLHSILRERPEDRPSVRQILSHPWMSDDINREEEIKKQRWLRSISGEEMDVSAVEEAKSYVTSSLHPPSSSPSSLTSKIFESLYVRT